MGAVEDLALRLHLRAVLRSASPSVSFGGSCCDECKQTGGSCGGVTFGTDVPKAPTPPTITVPYDAAELQNYASYVNDRVQALQRTDVGLWRDPTAQWWESQDLCADPNDPNNPYQAAKAAYDAGDENALIKGCRPAFWQAWQAVQSWETQAPRGGWNAWYSEWQIYYRDFLKNLSSSGYFTGGEFDKLAQYHKELVWMTQQATAAKLPLVPDPGTVPVSKSVGKQIGEGLGGNLGDIGTGAASSFLDSAGGLLLLAGGVYVGVKLLTGSKR